MSAVWVNSHDEGWVMHGQRRSTPERAAAVAALLARKLGWETAAGPTAPARRSPRAESRAAYRAIDLHIHDLRHEAGSRLLEAGW